ncbi:MAG: SUMF1/EgtB/PvdO family nonheme iron enzyme [Burkholderiales bacterium]|nr:SUMF1/EgtB/PvdO family nonheme iron enzyme [Burkholderiales bacterium]
MITPTITSEQSGLAQRLTQRVHMARRDTDALFDRIPAATLYERPIAERHRLIFYLGHLEAFDWNLLTAAHQPRPAVDPAFDTLFAFGIDPLGSDLPHDAPDDWPSLTTVQNYRRQARDAVDRLIAATPDSPDSACLLNAAIEHRLMHAETLAYLCHRLPLGSLSGPVPQDSPGMTETRPHPADSPMVRVPSGPVTLGKSRDSQTTFAWDNEYPALTLEVPTFDMDADMVTNRDYLRFVVTGAYQRSEFWTADDWAWVQSHDIQHPGFWRQEDGTWLLRTMFSERPLPMDWPVYVSQAEASAYARWAGKALPSEAQWMRAAYGVAAGLGNFDARQWDPQSVLAPTNVSAFGVRGLFGNGWEWTSTPFGPYPGFEPFHFYAGYSQNFFDGKHYVLKGGSPRTAACMMRPAFRNWFQAHYQHVYAGFRCVITEDTLCRNH